MSYAEFDAERAVVACVLRDPGAYWRVADLLRAEDFEQSDMRALWALTVGLIGEGKPSDAVTIGEVEPELAWLAVEVANKTPGAPANVRAYADVMIRRATLRRLRQAGQRIANLSGADAVQEAQRIISACMPRAAGSVASLSAFADKSWAGVVDRYGAQEGTIGIPTGYEELDALTAGWQPSDLIIIAARPSVGKTAFALQSALHAAFLGHPALFVSLEMSGTQLTDRALAHIGGVNALNIREPKRMDEFEWAALSSAKSKLAQYHMTIDESANTTVEAIGARIRQVDASERLGPVVIDYLTYIQPPKADNTAEAIQGITRSLKSLAKELNLPVILLSQLSRDGDGIDAPELKHLRSSGAIEQDADVVIFLHRPEKADRDLIKVTVAKQRNGPLGDFYLRADMARMRFHPTTHEPRITSSRPSFAGNRAKGGNASAAAGPDR